MLDFHGDDLLEQVFAGCFYPDWDEETATPYAALDHYFGGMQAGKQPETARLMREIAGRDDTELLRALRAFHCYHEDSFRADTARPFVLTLVDYLETGRRAERYERDAPHPPRDPDPELVTDLGGAWSVASTFDDIDQANHEVGLALRANRELVLAFGHNERPDVPTLRTPVAEPVGTVILNDGRFVRGRTAVAVLRRRPDGSDYVHTSYLEAEVDDGPDPRSDYPLLHLYLDGYLHQDWPDDYGTWERAFDAYLRNRSADERRALQAEIAHLRAQPDAEQTDVIVRCHSYLVPSRKGEDDSEWLDAISRRAAA